MKKLPPIRFQSGLRLPHYLQAGRGVDESVILLFPFFHLLTTTDIGELFFTIKVGYKLSIKISNFLLFFLSE